MKRFLCFKAVLISLLISSIQQLTASDWTLASQKFTFSQKGLDKTSSRQIADVLPKLILEQISSQAIRTLPSKELMDRELNDLQTERLSLFLQLAKENKTRDALVLSKDKPSQLRKALEEEDKKIREIESKIDANIQSLLEVKNKYEKKIAFESGQKTFDENAEDKERFPFPFFKHENHDERTTETVVLYKNDSSQLFSPSQDALNDGIKSFTYNKEVTQAKINGLLTGQITVYGEYLSVSVSLYLFPGASLNAVVTEVGSTSDLITIARNVVRNLTPKIANCLPVKIKVVIEPEEARSTALLNVDGVIAGEKDELVVDAGIHTITVSADGYESQTINYAFSGEDFFTLKTTLKPLVTGTFELSLKKMNQGTFFFNAMENVSVDEENQKARASVNGRPVLAVFTDKQGQSAFIFISEQLARDSKNLSVNVKPYDREQNIDKRRRMLYTAYSALICSLVPTFYCVGNFTAYNNSYVSGRASYDDVEKWQKYSYYSIGLSCASGAWFAIEVCRYLFAANEVLPADAKEKK
jgi:hypothetical protein